VLSLRSTIHHLSPLTFTVALSSLAIACGPQDELTTTADPITAADGGVVDGSSPEPLTPTPIEPLTRASQLRHRAEVAQRTGNSTLAREFESQITALSSRVPRQPHAKPRADLTCATWAGRNFIRFKFVEGTNVRLDGNRHFVSEGGRAMTPQFYQELNALNAILDLHPDRLYDASNEDLLRLKGDAERNTGEEQADLTLWYDALIGDALYDPITSNPTICNRAAGLLNQLNRFGVVEVAYPGPLDIAPPALPWYAAPVASPPSPSTVIEPDCMMLAPQGLNSPLAPARLHEAFLDAWAGESVGITDIEYFFYNHEKFNTYVIPGGNFTGSQAWYAAHAIAAMSITYGTAFSGNDPFQVRYGTRGFAPRARRAFSPQQDTEFLITVNDIPEAIQRAGDLEDSSDIIMMETQTTQNGQLTASEAESAVYDAVRSYASIGRIIVEAAGNGNDYIDAWALSRADSGAIMVGSNTGDGVTRRADSGFGVRVDTNAWGSNVDTAAPSWWYNSQTPGQPDDRNYIDNFNGTSSATAEVAGAIGQIVSVYRATYGLGLALPSFQVMQNVRNLLTASGSPAAFGSNLGPQPNVERAVSDYVLVNRLTGCTSSLTTPHNNYVAVGIRSGTTAGLGGYWPSNTCAMRSNGTSNTGALLSESIGAASNTGPLDLGYNPDRSFTIEAWINIAQESSNWQAIIAKENPRNYGLWVTPLGWPNVGRVHFSYRPQGAGANCDLYSTARVAGAGAWGSHHVALRFDRRPGTSGWPVITFFIDGIPETAQFGCGAFAPTASGGAGADEVNVATSLTDNSLVGDVRLYHRLVSNAEIAAHAGGAF